MNEGKVFVDIIYPFESKYGSDYIKVYYTLNDELENMIETSGYRKPFLSKYRKSLKFLEGLKTRCTSYNKLFEKLLEEDNLYSIMLFGEKNIRILFFFIRFNNCHKVILLNAFEEKDKSDYKNGKIVANKRKEKIINTLNQLGGC